MRLSPIARLAVTCGALLAAAAPGRASIISGSVTGGTALANGGTFVQLTPPLANPFGPPNSVGNDNFQNPNLYAFNESQNILLAAPLAADVGQLVLPAGTFVASHYVFFDPVQANITGTVNFDSPVLAIITSTGTLLASDFLAQTGVNYLNPTARGLEPGQGDSATISGPNQVSVAFTAGSPGDYIRVLTAFSPGAAPVPEPASLAVLAGLAGVGALRARRAGR